MNTLTIKQKMTGAGAISDIESDQHERIINFPAGKVFAFVKAAHYRDEEHEFFTNLNAAIVALASSPYSGEVVENDGSRYTTAGFIGNL